MDIIKEKLRLSVDLSKVIANFENCLSTLRYASYMYQKVCNISKFRKEKQEHSTNRHVFLMWKSPLRINGQTVGITILIFAVIQPNPFLNDILFQLFFCGCLQQ